MILFSTSYTENQMIIRGWRFDLAGRKSTSEQKLPRYADEQTQDTAKKKIREALGA